MSKSEALIGLGGVILGTILTAGFSYAMYLKQRADSKHDALERDLKSGLQAQRDAVREQFECAFSMKTWLNSLSTRIQPADSAAHVPAIREEANTRMNRCHELWDFGHMKVDSQDVQIAMFELDQALMVVIATFNGGDLRPELAGVSQGLQKLKDAANRRLDARWN